MILSHYEVGNFAETGAIVPMPRDETLLPRSRDHRTARLRQWEKIVRSDVR